MYNLKLMCNSLLYSVPDSDCKFWPFFYFFEQLGQSSWDKAPLFVALCSTCNCKGFSCSCLPVSHHCTFGEEMKNI